MVIRLRRLQVASLAGLANWLATESSLSTRLNELLRDSLVSVAGTVVGAIARMVLPAQNGRASSLFSTQRQVSVSVGVAILASVLAAYGALDPRLDPSRHLEALTGVRWAFGIAVGFALAAAIASLFIRDDDARATMVARRRS